MDSMGITKNPPTDSQETLSHKNTATLLIAALAEAARSVIFASAPGQPSECCVSSFFLSRFWQQNDDKLSFEKNSSQAEEKLEPPSLLEKGGIPVSIVPMVFFWSFDTTEK